MVAAQVAVFDLSKSAAAPVVTVSLPPPSNRPGELQGSIAAAAFARSGGHLALLLLSDDGVAYCHQLTNGFDAAQSHVSVAARTRLELPAAVAGRAGLSLMYSPAHHVMLAGPGRCCSPRHRMPFDSRNEGSKCGG